MTSWTTSLDTPMRKLQLIAYELEVGHLVLAINDRPFLTFPEVTKITWVKDSLHATMDDMTFILSPDATVDVVHPDQNPTYELADYHDE